MKQRIWILGLAFVFAFGLFASTGTTTASANGGTVHCVKYGETLWGIAAYYGVSAHAIANHNGIWNVNYIRAGQCLRIPGGWQGGHGGWDGGQGGHGGWDGGHGGWDGGHGDHGGWQPKPGGHGVHCVKYGETLWGIAWRHGVSVHAIAKANGIWNYNYIRAGQCLTIPGW